jgi:hypothetical protein
MAEDVGTPYGWRPKSPSKEMCLKALKGIRDEENLDFDIALRILFMDFQQDEDVVQYAIDEIKREQYPFLMSYKLDAWRLLSKNFRDNAALVSAVDEWITKQKDFSEPEVSFAALVGRTPTSKAKLLSSLNNTRFIQLPTASLLEGWGTADDDVRKKLVKIAYGPADTASWIAHFLPRIIENEMVCQERLMEILHDPKCERIGWVIEGLKTLKQSYNADEVVGIVLEKLDRQELKGLYEDEAISRLIGTYPYDERVRNLALGEFSKHDGNISALASVYGSDEEIRQLIIKHVNPLSGYLRGVIARNLGEMAGDDPFIISLLKDYDLEDDGNVKSLASISYHLRLVESGLDTSDALSYLQKNIVCYGNDYEIRRQAFFCGLVLLDRLDVIINARETIGSDRIYSISSGIRFSENYALINFILRHWSKIELSFGNDFFSRLNRLENNAIHLWDSFCLLADDYSAPRDAAISYFENAEEKPISVNILRFIGRTHPESALLLEYCIDAISREKKDKFYSRDITVIASELLGSHFGGVENVLRRLLTATEMMPFHEGKIISLCEGWPESEELNNIFELARQKNPQLSYPAYFHLICRKSESAFVFDRLINALSITNTWILQSILRPLIHRVKRDLPLVEMIEKRLFDNPTPSEKASLPKLLKAAKGLSENIKKWCTAELEQQLNGMAPPEIGNDIFSGESRPVVHSLMESLDESRRDSW